MKRLLFLSCLIVLSYCALSQDSSRTKKNYYLLATVTENNKKLPEAYLANVNDSAVMLSPDPVQFRHSFLNANLINYQQIEAVSLRRKGNVGRGIGRGALIGGLGLGTVLAVASQGTCQDCDPRGLAGAAFLGGALVGGFVGGLIGGIINGTLEKRFIIGGDKKKFDKMRLSVLEMAYRKN